MLVAKCKHKHRFRISKALQNTLHSYPDFIGDKHNEFKRGQTVSRDGPARTIRVWKCIYCGYSIGAE